MRPILFKPNAILSLCPFCLLAGDEWDTMLMDKPDFLPPPPPYEEKRRTTFEDFQRTSVDLDKLLAQQHSLLHDHAAPLSPLLGASSHALAYHTAHR